jgi:hypothetical protein
MLSARGDQRRFAHKLIAVLIFCAGVCIGGCAPSSEFGAGTFSTLSLARTPGLGFCIQANEALSAQLRRTNNEVSLSAGTYAAQEDGVTDTCLDSASAVCLVERHFAALTLTAQQVNDLEARIAAVPAKECTTKPGLACDPCIVTVVDIDGHQVDPFCCGDLNSDFSEQFDALVKAIDTLIPISTHEP